MVQLVSDYVLVLDPRKENLILDAQKVMEKMGVKPEQVADLLGLWGDASDNIPGAPGIGEKGAKELIQTFGSVEACLQSWDKIKKKGYQESLRDNAELIRMSRELATIRQDLDIDLDLDALVLSEPDRKAAFGLFAELEFKTLMREFLDEERAATNVEWLPPEEAVRFIGQQTGQSRIHVCLGYREGVLSRKVAEAACIQAETGPPAL